MRMRTGDTIVVFDGSGDEYPAEIIEITKKRAVIKLAQTRQRDIESPLRIHLVQGISRGERMDFVIQKSTELGVSQITPVLTDRTVVRLDDKRSGKRHLHWIRVAQNACEQCGRNRVPQIDRPIILSQWLDLEPVANEMRIVLRPGAGRSIKNLSVPPGGTTVLIGPEGGLTDMEHEKALYTGFEAVELGPRIMRTETAALAALAVLQSQFGDLG
jgi:16S rRNA (uracil1498-N3)-methyltransferase